MQPDTPKKEAMKQLREERQGWIAKATAAVKTQKKAMKAIRECLGKEPATVPRIAEATGLASNRVIWFIAAMKKYGEIVEDGQDGSYYRYALQVAKDTCAAEAESPSA